MRTWRAFIGATAAWCVKVDFHCASISLSMSERTSLESLLLRDRWVLVSALILIIALCWAWIVPMARDMYGSMDSSSAWMMTRTWDFTHLVLLFAMWVVMMIGMMLPSAAPTLLLYACIVRKSPESERAGTYVYSFAAGYLLIWTAFSLLATVLQRWLAHLLLLSPMMESRGWLGGALLIVAGLYQLTPFKRNCLESCRSPAAYIAGHWKRGGTGALRLGIGHGLYCLGCCWALMLLLFVGGVMNLWWIAALTIFVLLEKLAPLGAQGGRLSGLLILALGLFYLFK
jgi:predicted metal-binding membrane protein